MTYRKLRIAWSVALVVFVIFGLPAFQPASHDDGVLRWVWWHYEQIAALVLVLAAAPLVFYRFSVRTLLIVTTLVATAFGFYAVTK